MRHITIISLIFAALFWLAPAAAAQELEFSSYPPPGTTRAEIADSSEATPSFASLKTSLTGKINVRVKIDETGRVSDAATVYGPGDICMSVTRSDVVAVREAAAAAARLVVFRPAMTGDQPTASEGNLIFGPGSKDTAEAKNLPGDQNYTAVNQGGSSTGTAVSPSGGAARVINSDLLAGHAINLPKPPYPPAARAVRAKGQVGIRVVIETDGSVFSAVAVTGHPLLRAVATTAACGARFSPTKLSGNPVKVTGIISYNFMP